MIKGSKICLDSDLVWLETSDSNPAKPLLSSGKARKTGLIFFYHHLILYINVKYKYTSYNDEIMWNPCSTALTFCGTGRDKIILLV